MPRCESLCLECHVSWWLFSPGIREAPGDLHVSSAPRPAPISLLDKHPGNCTLNIREFVWTEVTWPAIQNIIPWTSFTGISISVPLSNVRRDNPIFSSYSNSTKRSLWPKSCPGCSLRVCLAWFTMVPRPVSTMGLRWLLAGVRWGRSFIGYFWISLSGSVW